MKKCLVGFLSTTFVGLLELTNFVHAQNSRLVFNQFPREDDPEIPASSIGRGSRGPNDDLCNQPGLPDLPLTALVPNVPAPPSKNRRNPYPERVLGLTAQSTPTLWFYVPYKPNPNLIATVELNEGRNGRLIRRLTTQSIPLTHQGLIAVSLKNTSLETGKRYQWSFSVACNPKDTSANDTVTGWIERVDRPEVEARLRSTTPQQKAQIYANAGLWQETLSTVAGELCQHDRRQAQAWFNDLMGVINRTDLTTKAKLPLLQQCPNLSAPNS